MCPQTHNEQLDPFLNAFHRSAKKGLLHSTFKFCTTISTQFRVGDDWLGVRSNGWWRSLKKQLNTTSDKIHTGAKKHVVCAHSVMKASALSQTSYVVSVKKFKTKLIKKIKNLFCYLRYLASSLVVVIM